MEKCSAKANLIIGLIFSFNTLISGGGDQTLKESSQGRSEEHSKKHNAQLLRGYSALLTKHMGKLRSSTKARLDWAGGIAKGITAKTRMIPISADVFLSPPDETLVIFVTKSRVEVSVNTTASPHSAISTVGITTVTAGFGCYNTKHSDNAEGGCSREGTCEFTAFDQTSSALPINSEQQSILSAITKEAVCKSLKGHVFEFIDGRFHRLMRELI